MLEDGWGWISHTQTGEKSPHCHEKNPRDNLSVFQRPRGVHECYLGGAL